MDTKPELIVTGPPGDDGPSLTDLIKMFRKLTSREPDAADVDGARAVLEAGKVVGK